MSDVDGGDGSGGGDVPMAGPTDSTRTGPSPALLGFVAFAVVVLIVGLVIWLANRDGDDIESAPSTTAPVITLPETTTPPTTVPETSTPDTTTPDTTTPDTTAPETTAPATTAPETTAPPTTVPEFALPEPGADTWTVALQTGQVVTMELAATDGDLRAYDGTVDSLRCVGVVGPGDDLTSWCGPQGQTATLVADRGLEPITVDLAPETGAVTLMQQPSDWTLGSNGCVSSLSSILAAVDPGAHAVTDVICVGNEAFVGIGSSLFGPDLAPDGGGFLVVDGDEGWNVVNDGTSIPCDDPGDGVDRCDAFGVEFDLFEALLPVPPASVVGASSVMTVQVTDRTDEVGAWIGDTTDPDEIVSIVSDQLVDPDAEVLAEVRRSGPIGSDRLELVVVEIPQFDDAFRYETWAVWIGLRDRWIGVTDAFSWGTCARGVTGDGLCV